MKKPDLHAIARQNRLDELRDALRSEIDLDVVDEFGATALHYAIAHKRVQLAMELIQACADVTVQNRDGKTALHSAIEHGLQEIVVAVVEKDANVVAIADKHGNAPLWTAAFNARGNFAIVEFLLAHGADANHVNNVGLCPLDIPRRMNDLALLRLLEAGGRG